jgi:hypothetical protein
MGCQRDILESVIEKIRRKIERQLPNDPEACDAILDILTGGIEEAREERCGMAAECSKAMRSANGASSSKKEVA